MSVDMSEPHEFHFLRLTVAQVKALVPVLQVLFVVKHIHLFGVLNS